MSARRIDYMPLGEVAVADRNPKRHADAAISRSFERFGYVEPIVVDERTGKLVAGHGRIEALRRAEAAGETPPPGIEVTPDGWAVPVVRGWESANDREADAYLVASNRLVEAGGWDDAMLAELLGELPIEALAATGFTEEDLDDIQHRLLGRGTENEGQSPKEREDAFNATGIRTIVLPFPAADAEYLARVMALLRKRLGLGSNSELLSHLVKQEHALVPDAAQA